MNNIQMSLFGEHQQIPGTLIDQLKEREDPDPLSPVVVAYGGGKNSTAMLIMLAKLKVKVDLILFADTGGELPETYKFIEKFNQWLVSQGMPAIITVRRSPVKPSKNRKTLQDALNNFYFFLKYPSLSLLQYAIWWIGVAGHTYATLEENCLTSQALPSKAYGNSSCSVAWKIDPQNDYILRWLTDNQLCGIHKKGRSPQVTTKVRKLVGYHLDEVARLIDKSTGQIRKLEDDIFRHEYPLMVHGIDELACRQIIAAAGLEVPPKSSCFFCPSMPPREIASLPPELKARADLIEQCANDGIHWKDSSVKGLGRRFSWRDLNKMTELEKIGLNFRQDSKQCHCVD